MRPIFPNVNTVTPVRICAVIPSHPSWHSSAPYKRPCQTPHEHDCNLAKYSPLNIHVYNLQRQHLITSVASTSAQFFTLTPVVSTSIPPSLRTTSEILCAVAGQSASRRIEYSIITASTLDAGARINPAVAPNTSTTVSSVVVHPVRLSTSASSSLSVPVISSSFRNPTSVMTTSVESSTPPRGSVRRVRSVLDMRLGPLATPTRDGTSWADAHLFDYCDGFAHSFSSDLFEFPAAAAPPAEKEEDGEVEEDEEGNENSPQSSLQSSPQPESRQQSPAKRSECALLLADSPSTLDLSALLC